MEPVLYRNYLDKEITHSSFSARSAFKTCARRFQLERVQGWWSKVKRAAPLYGKCVEAAVELYECSDRKEGVGVAEFERLWLEVKKLPDFNELVFTATEGSYDSLMRAGREMMLLYTVRAPYLPISAHPKALFQQTLRKKLFPGTELDKLENKAIFDILSFPRWDHKMLPQIDEPADKDRPLIIDIKTSGVDLNTELVALDPQLCEYAWQSRIPDVAFLWFVKHGHSLKKGSRITTLQPLVSDKCSFPAGIEMTVLTLGTRRVEVGTDAKGKPKFEDEPDGTAFFAFYSTLDEYETALKGLRGKIRDAVEETFLADNQHRIVRAPVEHVTKQRIQFGAARLSESDLDEIGRDVAQTTVEMVRCASEDFYPKSGAGIRFPNNSCLTCDMRWICTNNSEKRDQLLSRRGEEWLDGVELDEDVE